VTGGEIVALVSVVVTGVVGPFIGAHWAIRRLQAETRRDRENELRDVFENAAIKLTEAIRALDDARDQIADIDYARLATLAAELAQLWVNEDRIAVRLGSEASETRLYRQASEHVGEAVTLLSDVAAGEAIDAERLRALGDARRKAMETQRTFFDATSKRIAPPAHGPRATLPPIERGPWPW
jgi:hypothetical protein